MRKRKNKKEATSVKGKYTFQKTHEEKSAFLLVYRKSIKQIHSDRVDEKRERFPSQKIIFCTKEEKISVLNHHQASKMI